jgi:hypothetical protein
VGGVTFGHPGIVYVISIFEAPDALINLGNSPEFRVQAPPQLRFTQRARPKQRQSGSENFFVEAARASLILWRV